MQLPQISRGRHMDELAQSESSQSTRPSPSLSQPSSQISGAGAHAEERSWAHAPPVQRSMVQLSPSSQSDGMVQRWHPEVTVIMQLPSAAQSWVVQGFWSSQSEAVEQGVQPACAGCSHTPEALHMSV